MQIPNEEYFKSLLSQKSATSENAIKELISKNESLQDKLLNMEEKLKMKQSLDWQDRSMFEEILKEKQQLQEAIEELSQKMKELNQQQNKFNDKDPVLKQKADQLKELISSVLDEKTKKLFDELEQLLKEKQNVQDTKKNYLILPIKKKT